MMVMVLLGMAPIEEAAIPKTVLMALMSLDYFFIIIFYRVFKIIFYTQLYFYQSSRNKFLVKN